MEEKVLLQHHPHVPPQMGGIEFVQIAVVDPDRAGGGKIDLLQHAGKRGLAGTAGPDHPQGRAGRDDQGYLLQHIGQIGRIAKTHPVKDDIAPERRPGAMSVRAPFLPGIHDQAQFFHRQGRLLILIDQAHQSHQRRGHPAGQHLEGDQGADGQGAVKHLAGPHPDEDDRHHPLQKLGERFGGDRDLADPKLHADGPGHLVFPLLAQQRLDGHGLDRGHAVDGLNQHGLPAALGIVEGVQASFEGDDQHPDHQGDRQGEDQNNAGELKAVEEEKGQEDKERGGLEHGEKDVAGQKIADLGGLLHMLGQNTGGNMLEEIKRQVEQMSKGPPGHPQIDLVGGMQQQIIAEKIEAGVDRQGRGHTDSQDMQGGEGLIDQDLVDDDLEKDRGDQGDGVDKQHRQGDIDKGHFLPENLGDKPAQAEGLRFVGEFIDAFEDIDLAGPDRLELRLGQAEMAAAAAGQGVITGDDNFLG